MATADSIRFLASQMMGLGGQVRQDAQQAQSNAMAKRYQQLAEMKFNQEKQLQDQQTAAGSLEQMATSKAVNDMAMAKDSDPTHLAMYVARAKAALDQKTKDANANYDTLGMKSSAYYAEQINSVKNAAAAQHLKAVAINLDQIKNRTGMISSPKQFGLNIPFKL